MTPHRSSARREPYLGRSQNRRVPGLVATLAVLVLGGCSPAANDLGVRADAESIWGHLDCASEGHATVTDGGDERPTAIGSPPSEDSFRRLRVMDGDNLSGERCELGRNEHRYGTGSSTGTFQLYRDGERWTTFLSIRLPSSFPLSTPRWQTVMQMKQTQPSANGGGAPVLELQAYDGRWRLFSEWRLLWETRARKGVWTRIALDVTYSPDPNLGRIKVYIDANGDGDAADDGERSRDIQVATLRTEIEGGRSDDGIAPGEPIPSHLRAGLYHSPEIDCSAPAGCVVEIDNIQVVRTG